MAIVILSIIARLPAISEGAKTVAIYQMEGASVRTPASKGSHGAASEKPSQSRDIPQESTTDQLVQNRILGNIFAEHKECATGVCSQTSCRATCFGHLIKTADETV